MENHTLDLVRATAADLQDLLEKKQLTGVELIKATLAQIKADNHAGLNLRAVIHTAPESSLLNLAQTLDDMRADGKVLGPFHGIPILLKDVYLTKTELGMPTTMGSYAFMDAKSDYNANVVDDLIKEGLIIVGKTNVNELVSWKAMGSTNGWSAVGGQTNSAFVIGGFRPGDGAMGHTNPCGASTGSAVAVSAGFSPLALGSAVDGSLVQPAARAGLYALKPSIGSTQHHGVWHISDDFDVLGGMAKSTEDLARLTKILLTPEAKAALPKHGYLEFMRKDFETLTVGFVDSKDWAWPESFQPQTSETLAFLRDGYMQAMKRVQQNGGKVAYPVHIPSVANLMMNGEPATLTAIRHVYKSNVEAFMQSLKYSKVRTLQDIVDFNIANAEKEFSPDHPEQDRLLHTLNNPVDKETYQKALQLCRKVAGTEGIDKAMADHMVDLIAIPMDSPCPRIAAAAGYPIATMPIGVLPEVGRPFGLAVIAKKGREDLLFSFMSAYEAVSPPRPLPPRLAM